jgi:Helix-turn-helix.
MTQGELGKKLGYTTGQFVSSWENGASYPPKKKIAALSAALGVSESRLEDAWIEDRFKRLRERWAPKN